MIREYERARPTVPKASLLGLLLATLGTVLAVSVTSAAAHPGGGFAPPHARLSADDNVVTLQWYAPPDDAAHVGEAVGHFPPGTMEAFLVGPDDALPTDDEVHELATSPELEAYFLEHIEVRQDGVPCPGEVEVAEDFLTEGAELTFRCPETVEAVDVRVSVLHDQDPRYDTFGVDGTVWTVLFTSSQPEHRWDATAAADDAGTGSIPVPLLVAAALLVGALVVWWLFARRLRRVRRRPATYGAAGVRRAARHTRRRRRPASTTPDRP